MASGLLDIHQRVFVLGEGYGVYLDIQGCLYLDIQGCLYVADGDGKEERSE